jgi:4-hydroxy-tetrahydrodipicolinate synthase
MTTRFDWMQGCATALVTPFRKDGSIDDECFRRSVERQIKAGVRIVVPCGTTGESATMDDGERLHVIRMAVEAARGKTARVVAGTGSNNTASTIELTRRAREAGADAALIVAPYYNKPTQEGMFAHFSEIARSLKGFPLMLYNVPSRTASNISAETTLRLAEKHENVVATKEASGDLSQVMEIIRARPRYFRVFAGDDAAALPLIALGADGLVSVCSNEMPKEMVRLVERARAGAFTAARKLHYRLLPLMEANFIETSPAPCKFIMKEMGLLEENLRLPLVPVGPETRARLKKVIKEMNI